MSPEPRIQREWIRPREAVGTAVPDDPEWVEARIYDPRPDGRSEMKVPRGCVTAVKWVPLPILERFFRLPLFIPYYHMVSDGDVPHVKHLFAFKNKRKFCQDVEYLARRYHPIGLPDLIGHIKHGAKIPAGSFLLTFDDGYSEMASVVAPLLAEKGLPAIFFVNPDFLDNKALGFKNKASLIAEALIADPTVPRHILRKVPGFHGTAEKDWPTRVLAIRYQERGTLDVLADLLGIRFDEYLARLKPYLSSEQVRGLIGRGFAVGSHSLDHPLYGELGLEDQIRQTLDSLRSLREAFGLSYGLFAFPHTDRGVTKEFFRRIQDQVDLTFGTSNIFQDPVAFNLQRINFEKSLRPAREILVHYTAKQMFYQWVKKGELDRA